jgi:hypothetical protein
MNLYSASHLTQDTLLKIVPLFSYAVVSPGSWVIVGEPISPNRVMISVTLVDN